MLVGWLRATWRPLSASNSVNVGRGLRNQTASAACAFSPGDSKRHSTCVDSVLDSQPLVPREGVDERGAQFQRLETRGDNQLPPPPKHPLVATSTRLGKSRSSAMPAVSAAKKACRKSTPGPRAADAPRANRPRAKSPAPPVTAMARTECCLAAAPIRLLLRAHQ